MDEFSNVEPADFLPLVAYDPSLDAEIPIETLENMQKLLEFKHEHGYWGDNSSHGANGMQLNQQGLNSVMGSSFSGNEHDPSLGEDVANSQTVCSPSPPTADENEAFSSMDYGSPQSQPDAEYGNESENTTKNPEPPDYIDAHDTNRGTGPPGFVHDSTANDTAPLHPTHVQHNPSIYVTPKDRPPEFNEVHPPKTGVERTSKRTLDVIIQPPLPAQPHSARTDQVNQDYVLLGVIQTKGGRVQLVKPRIKAQSGEEQPRKRSFHDPEQLPKSPGKRRRGFHLPKLSPVMCEALGISATEVKWSMLSPNLIQRLSDVKDGKRSLRAQFATYVLSMLFIYLDFLPGPIKLRLSNIEALRVYWGVYETSQNSEEYRRKLVENNIGYVPPEINRRKFSEFRYVRSKLKSAKFTIPGTKGEVKLPPVQEFEFKDLKDSDAALLRQNYAIIALENVLAALEELSKQDNFACSVLLGIFDRYFLSFYPDVLQELAPSSDGALYGETPHSSQWDPPSCKRSRV